MDALLQIGDPDEPKAEVNAVAVKIPDFIRQRPDLWFLQVDAQFRLAKITQDRTKFDYLVAKLPEDVLIKCEDVIREDFKENSYPLLVKALKTRFGLSKAQRLSSIMDDISFDSSQSPSSFFRDLVSLAGDTVDYTCVLHRFMQRLPPYIAGPISGLVHDVQEDFLEVKTRNLTSESKLLEIADSIAIHHKPQTFAIKANYNANYQHNNDVRSRPNGQKICRIHAKYGTAARKCAEPNVCKFRGTRSTTRVSNTPNRPQNSSQSRSRSGN